MDESWPEALDLALHAWWRSRHPGLVSIVTHASEQALADFPRLRARTREEFDLVWQDVAARDTTAVATGWLSANLTTKVPELDPDDGDFQRPGYARERHAPLLRRLHQLSARGPDPRIARAGLDLVRAGRVGAWDVPQTRELYEPVLRMIEISGDPSVLPELQRLVVRPRSRRATVRSVIVEDLPGTIDALRLVPRGEIDLAPLSALLPSAGPAPTSCSSDSDQLLGLVYENPDDDELRTVLGDAWLENGGARAELVRLERAGVPPDDPRVRRFVRRHAAELVGDCLADVLVRPVFRDGLLHTATVRATQAASVDCWERAPHAPALATLRVLRKGHASGVRYASLATSPLAVDLRRVDADGPRLLEDLIQGPARTIEGIRITSVDWDDCVFLLAAPELERLRAVDVPYAHLPLLEQFVRHGIAERIEEFGVAAATGYLGYRGAPLIDEIDRVAAVFPNLRRLVVVYEGDEPMITFVRSEGRWSLEVRLPRNPERYYFVDHGTLFWLDPARSTLWVPPPQVESIELSGYVTEDVRAALERRWGRPVRQV